MITINTSKFCPVASAIKADSKGKFSLDLSFTEQFTDQSYRVLVNDEGQILLDPLTNVPEPERWLWQNPEALASLERGIQQADSGNLYDLGSFADYADLDIDD